LNQGLEIVDFLVYSRFEWRSCWKAKEQEVIQFYFRKIPLHKQRYLVISVFSNSLWLPRNFKKCPK